MAALLLPALSRPAPTRHPPIDPDALPSYRLLAIMVGAIAMLAGALGFSVDRHDLPVVMMAEVVMVLVALALRGRGVARMATAIEAMVLISAVALAAVFLTMLLGASALPYRDAWLERADALVSPGLSWLDMFRALRGHALLIGWMCQIYQSLQWQPFALVVLLAWTGSERFCWHFLRAWMLALIACVAVFPFMPAVGPYVHHGLSEADIPALSVHAGWQAVEVLTRVRDGSLRELGVASISGLVSFPSFHTAGAVLLFWGFRRVPVVGPAFMALDVGVILTAPLIGSHYFSDIIAGLLVALLAIAAVRPGTPPALPQARFWRR